MTQSLLSTDTWLLEFLMVGVGEASHIYTDDDRRGTVKIARGASEE